MQNKITILGSANAIPNLAHDNTHLLVQAGTTKVLIDCASQPVQTLEKAQVDPHSIEHLILTHFHPDHVAGAPLWFMVMWLNKRSVPLHVYSLEYTLSRLQANMGLYGYENWPSFYGLVNHQIPELNQQILFDNPDLRIISSPVKHLIPTLGLRFEFKQSGKSVCYSCDTEPCDSLIELARNCDILLHEAAGESKGHSSPAQAAEDARRANAKALWLIHYDYSDPNLTEQVANAGAIFGSPVHLATDFAVIGLD